MKEMSQQQAAERFDALPPGLQAAIVSERNADLIWEIGEANHLNERMIKGLAGTVGQVLLGILHPKGIAKEIERDLRVNNKVAASIAEEIDHKIFAPVSADLQNLYNPAPQAAPTTPAEPDAGDLLAPTFKERQQPPVGPAASESRPVPPVAPEPPETAPAPPPVPEPPRVEEPAPPAPPKNPLEAKLAPLATPQGPPPPPMPQVGAETTKGPGGKATPFIIHEEQEIEPIASGGPAPLARPHFFRSTVSEAGDEPVSARLEIGQEEEVERRPEIGRTGQEDVRIVNYAEPEVETDPFGRQKPKNEVVTEERPSPTKEKEIPPDNIVNLKDLPR